MKEKRPFSGLPFTTKGQPFFKLSTQIVNPNIPVPEKILTVKTSVVILCFVYMLCLCINHEFVFDSICDLDNLDYAIGFVMTSRCTETKDETKKNMLWE